MCVQLSPLCLPSLSRLQVALARVPFDLPLVYFTARAVSVRLISIASACDVCLLDQCCVQLSPLCTPSLLRLQVALARVPFDLPLVYFTAEVCGFAWIVAAC
jgi:hypothetical protein